MKCTKMIICINRAVVLGYMSRKTANDLIEFLLIAEKEVQ
jgi:hypothetical protein